VQQNKKTTRSRSTVAYAVPIRSHHGKRQTRVASRNFGLQEGWGTEPPNFVIRERKGPRAALLDVFPGLPEFRDSYVYANDRPGRGVDIDEAEAAN
jgi:mannonate dehydratase